MKDCRLPLVKLNGKLQKSRAPRMWAPGFLYKLRITRDKDKTEFLLLHFIYHLEDEKLQIIGRVVRPKDRVIAGLGPEFDLAQALVGSAGGLRDRLREQFLVHEM